MKKKIAIITLALSLLMGCSNDPKETTVDTSSLENEIKTLQAEVSELKKVNSDLEKQIAENIPATSPAKEVYSIEDTWEVPGQWKLTIDSVTPTEERNSYSDKNPEEVVVITYTYENIGYEGDFQDLFLTPDNVVDGNGNMASTYPAGASNSTKPTPIGATMNAAQESYGLDSIADTVKVYFNHYDGNSQKQKAVFEVPISR